MSREGSGFRVPGMMVLKGSGHTRKHRACVGVYGGLPFYMVLKGFAGFSGVSTMGFWVLRGCVRVQACTA